MNILGYRVHDCKPWQVLLLIKWDPETQRRLVKMSHELPQSLMVVISNKWSWNDLDSCVACLIPNRNIAGYTDIVNNSKLQFT